MQSETPKSSWSAPICLLAACFLHRSDLFWLVQLQESLQQMLQQMETCQKALSNFLEDKRSAFPRFYFIGDDDLLEVSKAPACSSMLAHLIPNMCLQTRCDLSCCRLCLIQQLALVSNFVAIH